MKQRFPLAIPALLGLSLSLMSSPAALAQNEAGSPQHRQHIDDSQAAARPFEGKITKPADSKDGKFVLQESSTGESYSLDNQEAARQYAGKNVKVIAMIDPNTNTLHVVDIKPAGQGK